MFIDSLGFGELIIIFALTLMFVNPRDMARFLRWMGKMQRKLYGMRREVQQHFEQLLVIEEAEKKEKQRIGGGKDVQRKWAQDRVDQIPAMQKSEAGENLRKQISDWEPFKDAKIIGLHYSMLDEIDTLPLIKMVLQKEKTLLLPYVGKRNGDVDTEEIMRFAEISNLETQLSEGKFGILEPLTELRNPSVPEPDLVFVPGRCFDEFGGRLGRGKGFYDKFLSGKSALKAGICFEAQITPQKLALESHDQKMDYLITEKKIREFIREEKTQS